MTIRTGGLLVLHAETPLHPGAGTAMGVVDLPIQRERHTGFPTIPGTALKGVLRDSHRRRLGGDAQAAQRDPLLVGLFGGVPGSDTPTAGALTVTDARLLAFPVRSLKGVFVWITCPMALERLARDARLVGVPMPSDAFTLDEARAGVSDPKFAVVEVAKTPRVILEELDFTVDAKAQKATEAWARVLAEGLLPEDPAFSSTRARFLRALVVLSDDDFRHFILHATEVVARIGLDPGTKTVKGKALFYQELLPPETIFYSVVLAEGERSQPEDRQAATPKEVLERFRHLALDGVLQVGADETTGRGFCATRFVTSGSAR
ncbi:MAG: type III-B CRISPR module RAMP protein Cmr4 [Deltaproteobacteria bacterium]|nr:type III-B CRISPR module RAMP protein Cmr4 [Deltaproteobacteria bacterium]